jgi:hypothetical protein
MKKALLARMGLRQRDLTWAGRELLDTYCRSKAKLVAVDRWLETEPLIRPDGSVPQVMSFYLTCSNTSIRALDALRGVIVEMAKEDDRYDRALDALAAEGRKTGKSRETDS